MSYRPAHFRVKPKTVAKIRRTKSEAYTDNWDQISKLIMLRDNYKCVDCGRGRPIRLEVHHVIPVSKGGRTVSFNLKTLCIICHNKKHS